MQPSTRLPTHLSIHPSIQPTNNVIKRKSYTKHVTFEGEGLDHTTENIKV